MRETKHGEARDHALVGPMERANDWTLCGIALNSLHSWVSLRLVSLQLSDRAICHTILSTTTHHMQFAHQVFAAGKNARLIQGRSPPPAPLPKELCQLLPPSLPPASYPRHHPVAAGIRRGDRCGSITTALRLESHLSRRSPWRC